MSRFMSVRKTLFSAGMALGASVVMALSGCGRDQPMPETYWLFFSGKGEEYISPVYRLEEEVDKADAQYRTVLLERLCDVAEHHRGVSQFVALDALFSFFSEKGRWPLLTDRVVKVIAHEAINLNRLPDTDYVLDEWLEKGGRVPEYLRTFLNPNCEVDLLGHRIILARGLPAGWTAENGSILVDGKTAAQTQGAYNPPDMPLEYAPLEEYIRPGDRTEHMVVVRVTVVAPNGTKVDLVRRTVIVACKVEDVVRRTSTAF